MKSIANVTLSRYSRSDTCEPRTCSLWKTIPAPSREGLRENEVLIRPPAGLRLSVRRDGQDDQWLLSC